MLNYNRFQIFLRPYPWKLCKMLSCPRNCLRSSKRWKLLRRCRLWLTRTCHRKGNMLQRLHLIRLQSVPVKLHPTGTAQLLKRSSHPPLLNHVSPKRLLTLGFPQFEIVCATTSKNNTWSVDWRCSLNHMLRNCHLRQGWKQQDWFLSSYAFDMCFVLTFAWTIWLLLDFVLF